MKPRKPRKPRCAVCRSMDGSVTPANFLAASSSDEGKTIKWMTICNFHRHGWNDDGDWSAPVYPLGEAEF